MIKHIWTVICSQVVIDQDTNNISLFNILEEVGIPQEVVKENNIIPIVLEIVSLWVRSDLAEPSKGSARISLIAPDGELLKTVESEVDLTDHERLRARGCFQGLPFKGEGVYDFKVSLKNNHDWAEVATIPVKIRFMDQNDSEQRIDQG